MFTRLNKVLCLLYNHPVLISNFRFNEHLIVGLFTVLCDRHCPRHLKTVFSLNPPNNSGGMKCHVIHTWHRENQGLGKLNVLPKVKSKVTGSSPVLFPLPNSYCDFQPSLVFRKDTQPTASWGSTWLFPSGGTRSSFFLEIKKLDSWLDRDCYLVLIQLGHVTQTTQQE